MNDTLNTSHQWLTCFRHFHNRTKDVPFLFFLLFFGGGGGCNNMFARIVVSRGSSWFLAYFTEFIFCATGCYQLRTNRATEDVEIKELFVI